MLPVNQYIDHTILKPTCLVSDIHKVCEEAKIHAFAAVCVPPNFVKLAEAYGHVGIQVTQACDVEPALREARRLKDRTVFLDILTDPSENVFPMVKAGKGITEMLLGSEDL